MHKRIKNYINSPKLHMILYFKYMCKRNLINIIDYNLDKDIYLCSLKLHMKNKI